VACELNSSLDHVNTSHGRVVVEFFTLAEYPIIVGLVLIAGAMAE
jgi:hypothetical protein